jgi:hypothetical protein
LRRAIKVPAGNLENWLRSSRAFFERTARKTSIGQREAAVSVREARSEMDCARCSRAIHSL